MLCHCDTPPNCHCGSWPNCQCGSLAGCKADTRKPSAARFCWPASRAATAPPPPVRPARDEQSGRLEPSLWPCSLQTSPTVRLRGALASPDARRRVAPLQTARRNCGYGVQTASGHIVGLHVETLCRYLPFVLVQNIAAPVSPQSPARNLQKPRRLWRAPGFRFSGRCRRLIGACQPGHPCLYFALPPTDGATACGNGFRKCAVPSTAEDCHAREAG